MGLTILTFTSRLMIDCHWKANYGHFTLKNFRGFLNVYFLTSFRQGRLDRQKVQDRVETKSVSTFSKHVNLSWHTETLSQGWPFKTGLGLNNFLPCWDFLDKLRKTFFTCESNLFSSLDSVKTSIAGFLHLTEEVRILSTNLLLD